MLLDNYTTRKRILYAGILLHLNIFIGFAVFTQNKLHFYLFDSLTSHWHDPKFVNITLEGQSKCPQNIDTDFCHTPCWTGTEYQEPQFVLTPNCTDHSTRELIFYVYSALGNSERRANVRQIFKEGMTHERNITATLFFVVGVPATPADNNNSLQVELEHRTHNDILQINISDEYIHLGFKGLAAMKWIAQCATADHKQYSVKLDDDSMNRFAHMRNLLMVGKEVRKRHDEVKDDLVCLYVMYEVLVYEPKQKAKWGCTYHQYYSRKYPHFCNGAGGMYMTPKVAKALFNAAKDLPIFHLDDNYISAFLRERACIKIRDWGGIYPIIESLFYTFLNLYSYEESFAYSFVRKDFHTMEGKQALLAGHS